MDKFKIIVERELKSKSASIIWPLLSTPEGFAKWMADDVKLDNNTFTFTWGNLYSNHEIRSANIIAQKNFNFIRLRWNDEGYEDTYFELKIVRSDITGDYILIITDYAIDGDVQTLKDIWEANLEALRRCSGI